ncbi:glycosyltransferase family 4 protein [Phocaeicola paurosaccharolyticus]|uniref:glycosyltransferase family 4 protein n=1 Tax=Phocaeicola paurosaccharolyticus TaxID=732242 RepID=UPI000469FEA8|nr:glycosyltransferase family 4 protein [Phocaeicola paurosaccharolyticus]
MNILFFLYHGFSDISGISKKVQYQINGLCQSGHNVDVCQYTVLENGHRVRMVNDEIIQDYGKGSLAAVRKRIDYSGIKRYIREHEYDIVYVRSFHNANPFTIDLFRTIKSTSAKIALEIPTYPYDKEYQGFSLRNKIGLKIDKLFRNKLAKITDAIVTFSDDKEIFGQRTICISNGIDFDAITIQNKGKESDDVINLVGVAEVHYWHGFDRLIAGLGEYYKSEHSKEVYFHIVGGIAPSEMEGSKYAMGFKKIISQYNIEGKVFFHGPLYGEELDNILNIADFAVGSLARHRSGIYSMKSLKNREYAARGIPFIYSERDTDFDNTDFIIKAPSDETPIDINKILLFLNNYKGSPLIIRFSIKYLTWEEQMRKVIKEL